MKAPASLSVSGPAWMRRTHAATGGDMRFKSFFGFALALGAIQAGAAFAQAYPAKPLRLILNVTSGAVGDVVMATPALRATGRPAR